ncbi:hypothetical protein TYRP_015265 [Tyrophagus putrescentiae]|nr:hypothetical protein TYRP_015265 [Tyrophagus putrescentiae]
MKQCKYEQKFEAYLPPLVRLLSPVKGTLTRTFASLEIFTKLEGVDVEALQSRPPPLMPLLPWHIRAKVLKVMLFTEVFAYWFQQAIVLLYLMAMAIFIGIYPHWAHHPWYMKVFEAYEMCWPLAFLLLLVRYVVFFTAWTVVGSVAFTSHVRELQAKVSCWLKQQQQQQFGYFKILAVQKRLPPGGRLLVERFLREHNLVCFLVVSRSGQLFGKVILGTICTQIPINVIFVRKMVLGSSEEETPFSLRLLLFVFCFAQLLIFAIIFLPLAWCQKVYHSPKKFIPRLMLLSSSASGSGASWWWRLRLKYNDLYGRLLRGPKFAISVGELHAVTYFSSMEFLFSYIAYLLMAFSKKNVI